MTSKSQQEYLKAAKIELDVSWDEFAVLAGIKPRAFKTYRMPESSLDYRALPSLARASIDRLLASYTKKTRKSSNTVL